MRILLIEDEAFWAEEARRAADALDGAELVHERDGAGGLARALAEPFDVLILDRLIETDDSDGLILLAGMRARGVEAPALILSSLGDPNHKVEGLESGADDYLAKPFDAAELRARLKSLVRRTAARTAPVVFVRGDLEVRVKARTAHWRGAHVPLSPQEFDILAVLAELDGAPADRALLWRRVWRDYPNIPPQVNVIDVAMARLRRAIMRISKREVIETVRGKGWRLAADAAGLDTCAET